MGYKLISEEEGLDILTNQASQTHRALHGYVDDCDELGLCIKFFNSTIQPILSNRSDSRKSIEALFNDGVKQVVVVFRKSKSLSVYPSEIMVTTPDVCKAYTDNFSLSSGFYLNGKMCDMLTKQSAKALALSDCFLGEESFCTFKKSGDLLEIKFDNDPIALPVGHLFSIQSHFVDGQSMVAGFVGKGVNRKLRFLASFDDMKDHSPMFEIKKPKKKKSKRNDQFSTTLSGANGEPIIKWF